MEDRAVVGEEGGKGGDVSVLDGEVDRSVVDD